ncbi:MAG: Fic family protein [Candidatus Omnitrophica bacterium]|nr:Fic family protein [Candidatus Omnitrophota bacterium]MDE2223153.1 Fic family protein [Candidatus Omnitrophota bacterium]
MVRKVRLNRDNGLKRDVQKLRDRFGNLINVTNAEWYSLFKEEIRNSIAIEGVFANRQELLDVLEHNKRTNKQKAAAILGYYEAAGAMYEYANNQFKEKEFVLRMADIKQIHTLLMRYEKDLGTYIGPVGDFRKNDIKVAQATFKPINMFHVRDAMELLIKWFNESAKKKTYDEVALAAMTHVWFETIHPFSDGNGRVGRILLSYVLIGQGLVNIAIKGIAKDEREQYYHVLEKSDRCFNQLHRLIEKNKKFTPKDVDRAIKVEEFNPFTEMVGRLLREAIGRLEGGQLSNLDKEAVLPLRDLAKIYDYSQDYLRNLINRGQMKAHKKGKLWYVRVQDLADHVNKQI